LEVAILDPQALMLPALRLASRVEINSETVAGAVREEHGLVDDDLIKLLSGKPWRRAVNNASWAIVWLGQAGLIQQVRDKAYTITDWGKDFLAKNPTEFSLADLRQLPTWKRKGDTAPSKDKPVISIREDNTEKTSGLVPETPQISITEPEARQSIRIQAEIAEIGAKMGFRIWIPPADRVKVLEFILPAWRGSFLDALPLNYDQGTLDTIRQIDVLWLKGRSIARAFEVEHTTAIYSGILRMADLLALQPNMLIDLHIVAPGDRREKVFRELERSLFSLLLLGDKCSFLSYDSIYAIGKEKFLGHMSDSILNEYSEYVIKDKI
jgi:hypothetical protein